MTRLNLISLMLLLPCFLIASGLENKAELDRNVDRIRQTFKVPGMALVIVQDGRVIHNQGYGVRRLGQDAGVDGDTIFGIASNTKAFAGVTVAMLVEAGLCDWDDPVIRHLPDFQMSDPYITRHLTIRDLFPHHSGLSKGAGDLLYFPRSELSEDDIYQRIAHIPIKQGFRQHYAYDNLLYIVIAKLVKNLSGKSWNDFVQARILTPLGMKRMVTSSDVLTSMENVTSPHVPMADEIVPIPWSGLDNNPAAGGLNGSVTDLSKWIMLQLNRGAVNDQTRLFSEESSWQMWTPVTSIPASTKEGDFKDTQANTIGYGIGWYITDYQGEKMVLHNGGLPGQVSRVMLAPNLNLGFAILTNMESGALLQALTYHIMDLAMDRPYADWAERYAAHVARNHKEATEYETKQEAARNKDTKPSLPQAQYAGSYHDAWYGKVDITQKDGRLRISFAHTPTLQGNLNHWQHDTFVANWDDHTLRADSFVSFSLKPDGSIDHIKMKAVSPRTDFSYDFHDLYLEPVVKEK